MMKKLLACLVSVVCFIFVFSACGSSNTNIEKNNDITDNSNISIDDNQSSVKDVSLDYYKIAEKATLQYESRTDEWRYTVYKDNTNNYDCYVVLWEYLKEIPEHIEIPTEIDGYPVIAVIGYEDKINSSIFINAHTSYAHNEILKSLSMPDSIIFIGKGAFCYCQSLSDIKWSQNITKIGECAFRGCNELKTWNPPANLNYISWGAFGSCGFTEIVIPDTVTYIGDSAFDSAYLEKVTVPATVTHIGKEAFGVTRDSLVIYGYAGSEAAKNAANENKIFKVIN